MTSLTHPRVAVGVALAAGLIVAPSAALAKSFLLVSAGADAWTIVDPSVVEEVPGGVVRRAATVTVRRNILDGDPAQPGYVRTVSDYDCINREVRWRSVNVFARSGSPLVTQQNQVATWMQAGRTVETSAALTAVCGGAGSSVVSADSIGALIVALLASWDPKTPQPAEGASAPVSKASRPAR